MLLRLMKKGKVALHNNHIEPIREMLEKTWDLSKIFFVSPGSADTEAVNLFNGFFGKLNQIVTNILKKVVVLASLAPDMFRFAAAFKDKSGDQEKRIVAISKAGKSMAGRIEEIAANTQAVSDDAKRIQEEVIAAMHLSAQSIERFSEIKIYVDRLVSTIASLDENSKSIGSIIEGINRISDETNILSLNARIEAVRGSSDSRGFKVIAEEISTLAKQSKNATQDIRERLTTLQNGINETVNAVNMVEKNILSGEELITDAHQSLADVGNHFGHLTDSLSMVKESAVDQSLDVKKVSEDIVDIEQSVKAQSKGVENMLNIAKSINQICDDMVVDTGIFHLSSHKRSRVFGEKMATDPAIISFNRAQQERALYSHLEKSGFIELGYITDRSGRQITSNIYSQKVLNADTLEKGYGNDWSKKEWFQRPSTSHLPFVSKVYRSSATGEFCFTVSLPLFDNHSFCGVLAIDINFRDMLNI